MRNRRQFIKCGITASALVGVAGCSEKETSPGDEPSEPQNLNLVTWKAGVSDRIDQFEEDEKLASTFTVQNTVDYTIKGGVGFTIDFENGNSYTKNGTVAVKPTGDARYNWVVADGSEFGAYADMLAGNLTWTITAAIGSEARVNKTIRKKPVATDDTPTGGNNDSSPPTSGGNTSEADSNNFTGD